MSEELNTNEGAAVYPQEERKGDLTEEVAYVMRDKLAKRVGGWQEQTQLEVSVVPTTNVKIELTQMDCIMYDIDPSWIGEEATFCNLAIFDGFYNMDSESYIEIEFMNAVRASEDDLAECVIGVRDISSHCEYVKKGLTIELDSTDAYRAVDDHLFDEFSLELVHVTGDPSDQLDNMMVFQMEVLDGACMLLVFRYFEEYMQMEAQR